jgi:hypothetical protein
MYSQYNTKISTKITGPLQISVMELFDTILNYAWNKDLSKPNMFIPLYFNDFRIYIFEEKKILKYHFVVCKEFEMNTYQFLLDINVNYNI